MLNFLRYGRYVGMENNNGSRFSGDVQVVQVSDVARAYSGKKGCACGCKGKYYEAGDPMVTKILRTIQANDGAIAIEGDLAFAEVGARAYTVYFKDAPVAQTTPAPVQDPIPEMAVGDNVVKRGVGVIGTIAEFRGSSALVEFGDRPSDRDWIDVRSLDKANVPATPALSPNQAKFVRSAKRQGLEVDFGYSGRGMFGTECPAVRLDRGQGFSTRAKVSRDQMGLGTVVYAER